MHIQPTSTTLFMKRYSGCEVRLRSLKPLSYFRMGSNENLYQLVRLMSNGDSLIRVISHVSDDLYSLTLRVQNPLVKII